jgi:hypothetical protein
MKKLAFITSVIVTCIIVFACQPPKPGGYDAPSKNNAGGQIEEIQPQKTDSSIEKSIGNKGLRDSTKSK